MPAHDRRNRSRWGECFRGVRQFSENIIFQFILNNFYEHEHTIIGLKKLRMTNGNRD